MEARAQLRYMKASPQKVRLVVDLVRGKKVEDALEVLRFTKKSCAKDLEKLLRSAVANAENAEAGADIDELVVSKIWVDEGPREKRIQPAPMGRAYQIIKRQSHVTVMLSDEVVAEGRKGRAQAEAKTKKAKASGRARRK
ncbi:MAG: 50S ribosomal protein L22 [Thermoanaerobaculia bacterium]